MVCVFALAKKDVLNYKQFKLCVRACVFSYVTLWFQQVNQLTNETDTRRAYNIFGSVPSVVNITRAIVVFAYKHRISFRFGASFLCKSRIVESLGVFKLGPVLQSATGLRIFGMTFIFNCAQNAQRFEDFESMIVCHVNIVDRLGVLSEIHTCSLQL